jgi:aspartate carbamoyltransferase catalytic subunit
MNLKSKDLLGLKDLSREEIELILDTAKTMKMLIQSPSKRAPHLSGKSIVYQDKIIF